MAAITLDFKSLMIKVEILSISNFVSLPNFFQTIKKRAKKVLILITDIMYSHFRAWGDRLILAWVGSHSTQN